ncbi:MAG: hypothetical protein K6E97_07905 [Treponema sp.]|nr:hypothetical protein [Treponema sp.]
MKKLISFALLFFMAFSAFAGNGKKQTRVLKTVWFDIIYREGSEQTVQILKDNLDSVYEEVSKEFGMEVPYFRMPVVVVQECEQFNAYFASAPYNHIVLYDAAVSSSLKVFSETIISTLKHEITHAVTFNHNNKFWKGAKKIFGDIANPAVWNVSSGIAEGATVSGESKNGEGRLNDEYFWHVIKQAKLEDKFPSFEDVKGASEISPSGDYYYFNGAFSQYLLNKYGEEKYAQWWYKIANMEAPSARLSFEKVYDIPFNSAWVAFKNSIELPQIEENPSYVNNLTEENRNQLYSSLTGCKDGIAWVVSGSVYYASTENLNLKKIRQKKLFSLMGVQKLSFSADGRYLAASFIDYGLKYPLQKVMIYDMQTKKKHFVKEHGISEASIVSKNGTTYLLTTVYENANYRIKSFVFDSDKNLFTKDNEIIFPVNVSVSDYVDIGNGDFAFIQREGMNYFICVRNASDLNTEKQKFEVEQGMAIRYLSKDYSQDDGLLFTWTKKGTFPSAGKLSLKEGKNSVQLFTKNLNGGIYFPVFADKMYFIGKKYRENIICSLTSEEALFEQKITFNKAKETSLVSQEQLFDPSQITADSKKYNALSYFTKGIFLPVSIYQPVFGAGMLFPLGVTYYSGNPMDTQALVLSAGTDMFLSGDTGITIQYQNKTPDDMFGFSASANVEFGAEGFTNVSGAVNVVSNIFFKNFQRLSFENLFSVIYGDLGGGRFAEAWSFLINGGKPVTTNYISDSFVAEYSNLRKTGENQFEKAGFTIDLIAAYGYGSLEGSEYIPSMSVSSTDVGLSVRAYVPKLLPIDCKDGLTCNLPLIISVDFLNRQSYKNTILYNQDDLEESNESIEELGKTVIDYFTSDSYINSARAEMILYGKQIQKGGRWLYMNDFYISADAFIGQNFSGEYSAESLKIKNPQKLFEQIKTAPFDFYYGLNLCVDFSLNFGALATPQTKNSLIITILKRYSSETNKTTAFSFGFNLNL